MGSRNLDRYSPCDWRQRAETLGTIAEQGWRVFTHCQRCSRKSPVDLAKLAQVRGLSFSPWGLDLLECKIPLCRGEVWLMMKPPGAPAFPAWSAASAAPGPSPTPNNALWSARRRERAGRRAITMDEQEMRLAAVELVLLELMPWLDPAAVEDAERSIADGAERAGGDELVIRRQALALIRDGRGRFQQVRPRDLV